MSNVDSTATRPASVRRVRGAVQRGVQRGAANRALRPAVLAAVSVLASLRRRELCWITASSGGTWLHHSRSGSFLDNQVSACSLRQLRGRCRDIFLHVGAPPPGGLAIDIGAGIGVETLVLSELVGPTGRVIAIEAFPSTYAVLCENLRRWNLKNVTPLRVAIGSETGATLMSPAPFHQGNYVAADASSGVAVPSERLDDVMAQLGSSAVDYIKMNIEGSEVAALRGMHTTLQTVSHLVVSCHDFKANKTGDPRFRTLRAVHEILTATGFQITRRVDDPRVSVADFLYATRP